MQSTLNTCTASTSRPMRQHFGCSRLPARAPRAVGRLSAASRRQQIVCVLDITEDEFETEVLKSDKPVLVDFWATWCGPCKLVAPSMVWAEKEYGDALKVVKVEADPNPNLVKQFEVYGLPTLILFREGEMVPGSKSEGAVTKKALIAYLERYGVVPAKA